MKTLVVITGPTGSGKTALSISLARRLGCHIISADSRQIYKGIPIITATPTPDELALIPHHNVARLPLEAYYSASQFEEDALQLLNELFRESDYAIVCGGSMMYVDALTRGIDDIPTISEDVRTRVADILEEQGINRLREMLRELDPKYFGEVDLQNTKRVAHAVEICLEAGVPYSSLRTGTIKKRPFRIVKVVIDWPREMLFDRINRRVRKMVADGMLEEARSVYHLRHLNSLNTVGFKEMFAYIEGKWDFETACARIAKHTRVYAKKQLTWLKRDADVHWLNPLNLDMEMQILNLMSQANQ